MSEIIGLNISKVTDWLSSNLDGFPAPYKFDLVAAGSSNLTYIVTSSNSESFVLRRPPLRARIATAHDMRREYRIMSALTKTNVPVPAMLAYGGDESVNGTDFYCMERIEGIILRDLPATREMSKRDCLRATESLIDTQIAFHQIDLEAVGLSDLSSHDGYLQRQLKRWRKQVEVAKTRDLPLLYQLHEILSKCIPSSTIKPSLAHGDYRFDNTVLTKHYQVAAVLDWELCTIGNPIADFIWSLNYWAEPDDKLFWLMDPPTKNPLFPHREQVINLYQKRSGSSLNDISWYTAFSWWKQACIVEGVYSRMQQGATGGMKVDPAELVGQRVESYLQHARSLL